MGTGYCKCMDEYNKMPKITKKILNRKDIIKFSVFLWEIPDVF